MVSCVVGFGMDATYVLLGGPWQFDVDANHRGRLNQYVIKVDDRRVALLPLPQIQNQKMRSLIYLFRHMGLF